MKDVKVERASGPSFQPSQKARDWSSLSQNLEDAFVVETSASKPLSNLPISSAAVEDDDWGDFASSSVELPKPSLHQPVFSQPTFHNFNGLIANDGDPPLYGGSNHHQKPKPPPLSDPPLCAAPSKPQDDDDFADFVSNVVVVTEPPQQPKSQQAGDVGHRLATFQQTESPVHLFQVLFLCTPFFVQKANAHPFFTLSHAFTNATKTGF